MGLILYSNNGKYSFDMGIGGFYSLRKNIAMALDPEFGINYSHLSGCHTEAEYQQNDKEANRIIRQKHLDRDYSDVIDFLYASDCEGTISHKTCGKIYNLIKDVDFKNKGFRYSAYMHNDYEEFKILLKDCFSKRRKLRWF